ncbi:MAG: Hydantoin racemase [Variovorax sp.]|nr:Hydantoin racemase [Variovorax sp.]
MKKPVVLLINPNTSEATTAMMHRLARAALPDAFDLQSATAARGVAMITTAEELAISVDEVLAIGRAKSGTVSAIVISAFGDPGAAALRVELSVPVIGIGEASMREAAHGGRRFGVATTTPGLDAAIVRAAALYGFQTLFTGCRISADDPLQLAGNPALQVERLAEAVTACIEQDGAEAVVIGGGPLGQSAAELEARVDAFGGVPVIAPIAAAMRAVAARLSAEV